MADRPVHHFSVDVEEHFQVSAFEQVAPRDGWSAHPSRVVANTARLLDLLASSGATGTFFVLGWVAERHPDLVRRIVAGGHEIGSHSWWHQRVLTLTPAEFRRELHDSKALLEDISGTPVEGFRAPSFSIVPGIEWAFDILLEEGYRYDSSVFPIQRPGYGYPGAPLGPYWIERPAGRLLELPLATLTLGGLRIPAAGGGYLRQFPPAVIRGAFRQAEQQRRPGMFYIHPWEVDPEQPRLPVGTVTRIRHYRGLARTAPRISDLLGRFRFVSVRAWRDAGAELAELPVERIGDRHV